MEETALHRAPRSAQAEGSFYAYQVPTTGFGPSENGGRRGSRNTLSLNGPFGPKKLDVVPLQYILAVALHRRNLEKPIWSSSRCSLSLDV